MATLYERLGKGDGIRRIVDHTMAAHLANPVIKSRFEGIKDLDHAKAMAWGFFCAGSGGPEPYAGRDMREAHRHMNISEQEYLAGCDDILLALDKSGMDQETRKDVLAILYSLKDDIIRV